MKRLPVHCRCGRFAKFISERSWFDGNFTRITLTVECTNCGVVEIECV